MKQYTIGQLALAAGVPTSTVRYYERRGLVEPVSRSDGNYRLFDTRALDRLRFIRSSQAAGFTLTDIGELLGFEGNPEPPNKVVQGLISSRLAQVVEQRKHLEVVERMLSEWMEVCRESECGGRCGVLDGLGTPS